MMDKMRLYENFTFVFLMDDNGEIIRYGFKQYEGLITIGKFMDEIYKIDEAERLKKRLIITEIKNIDEYNNHPIIKYLQKIDGKWVDNNLYPYTPKRILDLRENNKKEWWERIKIKSETTEQISCT